MLDAQQVDRVGPQVQLEATIGGRARLARFPTSRPRTRAHTRTNHRFAGVAGEHHAADAQVGLRRDVDDDRARLSRLQGRYVGMPATDQGLIAMRDHDQLPIRGDLEARSAMRVGVCTRSVAELGAALVRPNGRPHSALRCAGLSREHADLALRHARAKHAHCRPFGIQDTLTQVCSRGLGQRTARSCLSGRFEGRLTHLRNRLGQQVPPTKPGHRREGEEADNRRGRISCALLQASAGRCANIQPRPVDAKVAATGRRLDRSCILAGVRMDSATKRTNASFRVQRAHAPRNVDP